MEPDNIYLDSTISEDDLASFSKNCHINEYQKLFVEETTAELSEEFMPFQERLTEVFERNLIENQFMPCHNVVITGNPKSGKSVFIRSTANRFKFRYVKFSARDIVNFCSKTFCTTAAEHAVEGSRVLIHIDLTQCSESIIYSFRDSEDINEIMPHRLGILVIEIDDINKLKLWPVYTIGIDSMTERERMFAHFMQQVILPCDVTYRQMSRWAYKFEIGDIRRISLNLRAESKKEPLSKAIIEAHIKEHKLGLPSFVDLIDVRWDVIGEHEIAIKAIVSRLKDKTNAAKRNGFLLHGPPGCWQTMLVKQLCHQIQYNLIYVRCSDIMNKYHGESENNIRNIFNKARRRRWCILFFDELDALCSARDTDSTNSENSVQDIFLTQLDLMLSDENSKVLVIGATGFMERIDSAAVRSDRFSEHIAIGLPATDEERFSVLRTAARVCAGHRSTFSDDDNTYDVLRELSQGGRTAGWSHVDLAYLIYRCDSVRAESKVEQVTLPLALEALDAVNKEKRGESVQLPPQIAHRGDCRSQDTSSTAALSSEERRRLFEECVSNVLLNSTNVPLYLLVSWTYGWCYKDFKKFEETLMKWACDFMPDDPILIALDSISSE